MHVIMNIRVLLTEGVHFYANLSTHCNKQWLVLLCSVFFGVLYYFYYYYFVSQMNLRSVFTAEQQRILERYYENGMTNQSKACFQLILQCAQEAKLDFSVVRVTFFLCSDVPSLCCHCSAEIIIIPNLQIVPSSVRP